MRAAMLALKHRWYGHFRNQFSALFHHEGGLSALEFALIAPAFVIGFLTAMDLGLAAHQHMTMDHILRAGAQSAMSDPGVTNVLNILNIAAAQNFTVDGSSPSNGKPLLTLTANRYCACPDTMTPTNDCSIICKVPKPALAFYSLRAERVYDGIFVPPFTLAPKLEVQVR
jgi:Flp pilus assembly protein TadG